MKKKYTLCMKFESTIPFEATDEQIKNIEQKIDDEDLADCGYGTPELADIIEDVIGVDIHGADIEIVDAYFYKD